MVKMVNCYVYFTIKKEKIIANFTIHKTPYLRRNLKSKLKRKIAAINISFKFNKEKKHECSV